MTAKEKQGFGLYFLFAFGMAWLCQVGGCIALLQQNNAVLYQLALIVTMFCPLLAFLLPQYRQEGRTELVIAVGCTGGRHRSTAVAHHLATFIGEQGFPVSESHRDISR